MRKGPGSVYDKWNISVVICDTDIPSRSTKSWWRYVINEERTGTYLQTLLVKLRLSIFRNLFTQRLTLRGIPRTSDAYDNPLTSCSIPYTDLRAIIMNWILKRWQDSWDQQINNKLLVIHSFVGKILCSYGQ